MLGHAWTLRSEWKLLKAKKRVPRNTNESIIYLLLHSFGHPKVILSIFLVSFDAHLANGPWKPKFELYFPY